VRWHEEAREVLEEGVVCGVRLSDNPLPVLLPLLPKPRTWPL
jgi:hypothetical protein